MENFDEFKRNDQTDRNEGAEENEIRPEGNEGDIETIWCRVSNKGFKLILEGTLIVAISSAGNVTNKLGH